MLYLPCKHTVWTFCLVVKSGYPEGLVTHLKMVRVKLMPMETKKQMLIPKVRGTATQMH